MGLANGFVPGVDHGEGFAALPGSEALLLTSNRVFDVEYPATLAAVENKTTFHRLRLFGPRL